MTCVRRLWSQSGSISILLVKSNSPALPVLMESMSSADCVPLIQLPCPRINIISLSPSKNV
uniref:Uncharacterized protein n=1 Tax=Anguilla anguilla TaxID=7936 RepID=A0A0E9WU39_ANGAN